ncbi:GntR family transcriptional regulator [Chloroflexota bacterium]
MTINVLPYYNINPNVRTFKEYIFPDLPLFKFSLKEAIVNIQNKYSSPEQEFRVDHKSPVPLYHQIYLHLRHLIVRKKLTPNEMFPTEMELTELFSVGRHTIREALSKLVDDGFIERYSGRGTFVRELKDRESFYLDRSFSHQIAALGLVAHSKVLENFTGIIDSNSPLSLQKKRGVPFLQLTRIRYGNDIQLGVQTAILLIDRCPDIQQYDFSKESLYHILSSIYHLKISEIHNEISAGTAAENQSSLIGVEVGDPILIENTVTYLADGEPIEATNGFYRSDRYNYNIRYKYRECD